MRWANTAIQAAIYIIKRALAERGSLLAGELRSPPGVTFPRCCVAVPSRWTCTDGPLLVLLVELGHARIARI